MPTTSCSSDSPRLAHFTSAKGVSMSRDNLQAEILAITGVPSLSQVNCSPPSDLVSEVAHGASYVAADPNSVSWAAVAKSVLKPLNFHPPVLDNGKLRVKVPHAIHDEGIKLWEDCLIGTFMGDAPSYGHILSMANHIWGRRCHISVTGLSNNSFLFKIPDPSTRAWVLNFGPWHVAHKTLVMRKWEPNYKEFKQDPKRMPIWVKLWDVPMDLLSVDSLCYIASGIGVPLALDKATEDRTRVDFAKVCVEIEVANAQDLPEIIPVDIEDFPSVDIRVEYPWLPTTYGSCKKKRHTSRNCKTKKPKPKTYKKEWVEVAGKNKPTEAPGIIPEPNQVAISAPKVQSVPLVKVVDVSPSNPEVVVNSPVLFEAPLTDVESVAIGSMPMFAATTMPDNAEPNPLRKQNSFAALAAIDDEQAFPPLKASSLSPRSSKKRRQASLGVAAVTKALAPRQRNTKKVQNSSMRKSLWDELVLLSKNLPEVPLILGGDFNEIRFPQERSDWFQTLEFSKDSELFHERLNEAELLDLPALGPQFTWTNKREIGLIARKLDRLMVNGSWLETFPSTRAEFLPPDISDHCAGAVTIMAQDSHVSRKPFKFFNFWTKNRRFLDVVKETWSSVEVQGCYMFQLCKKLKALKAPLRKLNKECYGNLPEKLQQEEQAKKVTKLSLAEEVYLKQKSRVQWLKEGDQNTTYFHKVMKVRRSRNMIREIYSDDGELLTQYVDIAKEAVGFFERLLGTEDPNCNGGDLDLLRSIFDYQLPDDVQQSLTKPITADECRFAFFSSLNNKSLGPDGYTIEFYKAAWNIVGDLVTKAIQEFFLSRKLLREVNSTIISLVPKVPCPSKMTEYRPIACCNLLYKCITKIIANRLKKCLPLFISNNQCAFVEGRLMVENILLAQEIVKHYHKPNMKPRCALKIDLMKAFDSVSWKFLLIALEALGFPIIFITWIRACITSPMFSVALNGNLEGYFPGKKGIRQGDPLSPYLFVICMEVLSRLLNKAAQEGNLPYHPNCKKTSLTHLCFVDDLLIFTDGSSRAVGELDSILKQFYLVTGLKVNYQKSEIFCCGMPNQVIRELTETYGFKVGTLPVRINSWSSKYLSFAGRLQLISSVLQGITNFWCSVFILPKRVITAVEAKCSAFLWKGKSIDARGAKVGSIWVAWVKEYLLKGKSFWSIQIPNDASWSWRKILKLRSLAKYLVKHIVGTGDSIYLWYDFWHPNGPLIEVYGQKIVYDAAIPSQAKLSQVIQGDFWKWPPTRSPALLQIQIALCGVLLSTKARQKRWTPSIDDTCMLCKDANEFRDHLFFSCPYSRQLWEQISLLLGVPSTCSWQDVLTWFCRKTKRKALYNTLLKLAWCASIYYIWTELLYKKERGKQLYFQLSTKDPKLMPFIIEAYPSQGGEPEMSYF
ncbi:hypothetical protein SLEP1_g35229 [Rubroshorea leprosula]|uniref:Reverse transcriptase domain-containing protein n=1 Tax=Rubroshorea leprosula TaxID=152421 RepID=A0AAV5KMT8_9ROSI|nr:hypothetical protein SLEP1_g35229 [Rubroshorea leprosula]